jgi:hypothetical protein
MSLATDDFTSNLRLLPEFRLRLLDFAAFEDLEDFLTVLVRGMKRFINTGYNFKHKTREIASR